MRVDRAFTIAELIIVISIGLVLVGLILATSGYVLEKAKRSRAETEIAALSTALENYKADNGVYPIDNVGGITNNLDARTMLDPTAAEYAAASLFLYKELSGDSIGNRVATGKGYFAFKPTMLLPKNEAQPVNGIADPFGYSYGYSTASQVNPAKGYNPTFDLWSTDGIRASSSNPQDHWIKNW